MSELLTINQINKRKYRKIVNQYIKMQIKIGIQYALTRQTQFKDIGITSNNEHNDASATEYTYKDMTIIYDTQNMKHVSWWRTEVPRIILHFMDDELFLNVQKYVIQEL
jgi:hypothetical protein